MPASLFADWYRVPSRIFTDDAISLKGWDIFESTDALLVLAAAATLVLLARPFPRAERVLLAVGAIATGAVMVELLNKPTLYALPSIPGMTIEAGAWLGLLGAGLVFAAGGLGWHAATRNT
jgi:hypothetical protein